MPKDPSPFPIDVKRTVCSRVADMKRLGLYIATLAFIGVASVVVVFFHNVTR